MAATDALIGKAARAAQSAALLLTNGDIDGACNRAYYAMFDAARAALCHAATRQDEIRSHGGMIAAFGLWLVKTGKVERSLGHALNRAHEIRLVADYTGDLVDTETAQWVVREAAVFVEAMRAFVQGT